MPSLMIVLSSNFLMKSGICSLCSGKKISSKFVCSRFFSESIISFSSDIKNESRSLSNSLCISRNGEMFMFSFLNRPRIGPNTSCCTTLLNLSFSVIYDISSMTNFAYLSLASGVPHNMRSFPISLKHS